MSRIITIVVVAVLISSVFGIPGQKVKRGFNNSNSASGRRNLEFDELDASVNDENGSICGGNRRLNEDTGSQEMHYNENISPEDTRGGHTFSKSSATAFATSTSNSYNANKEFNVVPR